MEVQNKVRLAQPTRKSSVEAGIPNHFNGPIEVNRIRPGRGALGYGFKEAWSFLKNRGGIFYLYHPGELGLAGRPRYLFIR